MMSCVWVDGCRSRTRCHLLPAASNLYRQRSRMRRARREQPHSGWLFSRFAHARWSEPVLDSNADEVNVARAASGVSDFVDPLPLEPRAPIPREIPSRPRADHRGVRASAQLTRNATNIRARVNDTVEHA